MDNLNSEPVAAEHPSERIAKIRSLNERARSETIYGSQDLILHDTATDEQIAHVESVLFSRRIQNEVTHSTPDRQAVIKAAILRNAIDSIASSSSPIARFFKLAKTKEEEAAAAKARSDAEIERAFQLHERWDGKKKEVADAEIELKRVRDLRDVMGSRLAEISESSAVIGKFILLSEPTYSSMPTDAKAYSMAYERILLAAALDDYELVEQHCIAKIERTKRELEEIEKEML